MPHRLQYLITGTGRCGTGFMSQAFTSAGLSCGHESVFGFRKVNAAPVESGDLVAESSWCAAPRLNHPLCREAVVIHLVRNPLKVIRSLLAANYYQDPPKAWDRLLVSWLPKLTEKRTKLSKALHHYVHWNLLIESLSRDRQMVRFRIEDDVNDLLKSLGEERVATFEDRNYNTRRHRRPQAYDGCLTVCGFPTGEDKNALIDLAERYGYPL